MRVRHDVVVTSPPQPAPGQQPGGLVGSPAWPAPAQNLRHPLDPDVRPSTKATAVLVLGISAVLLMFCVGGAVPAVVALNLARSARDELDEAKGFLSGDRQLGLGVTMSWIALAISVAVLVIGLIVVLLTYGADPSPNFGDNVD
jgi:hypothetical protein